jgi:xylulokinase
MSSPTYVIGIDCSTTATKAVVWDQDGHSVAEGRCAFPLSKPRPGWHEQDAEDWWRSTVTALREVAAVVDSRQIGAIGLTHQRETFVCAGEDGRPLRPAIMWLDSRSGPQVKEYGSERMHRITGKVPDPTPALYKLYWLRDHEPGLLERSAKVVDVHGFLVHRLTGNWQTSWATADPLGLVDMETFDWSDEILSELGLGRGQLCELVPPGEVLGELRSDVAQEVGLPAGLPVVAGAGDGQAAGLGANVTAPGNAYLNLGTAVVSGTYSDHYAWGQEFRTLSGPIPGTYTLETLLRGGTYIVSWFVEQLGGIRTSDLGLDLTAEQVLETAASPLPPGSEGLFILPYWNAAQTPYWDPTARGVAFGLQGHHGKAHIFRAILEGIAFEQRLMTDGAETALGQPIERFLAMGGGSRSSLFCQIVADVTRRPVYVCRYTETTSLGAAMHAAAAIGWFPNIREAAAGMSGESRRYEPDVERTARYERLYTEVYKELYGKLAPLFSALEATLEEQEVEATGR